MAVLVDVTCGNPPRWYQGGILLLADRFIGGLKPLSWIAGFYATRYWVRFCEVFHVGLT